MAACPGCSKDEREPSAFTCPTCWELVPVEIRAALQRRDRTAVRYYRKLLDHCKARRHLAELTIG